MRLDTVFRVDVLFETFVVVQSVGKSFWLARESLWCVVNELVAFGCLLNIFLARSLIS